MKSDIARNTRLAESSRPFMCGLAPDCTKCVPVIISDEGVVTPKAKPVADAAGAVADVEPVEQEAL